MSDYLNLIINFLQNNSVFVSNYLPIIAFLTAFMESTPIFGPFTPGTLFLILFGFLIYNLHLNLLFIIFTTTLGAVLGDMCGYYLGLKGKNFLLKHKKFLKEHYIEHAKSFFSRHGGKSIFIGRFIGPIRPIVPIIAGSVHMNIYKFIYYNSIGAIAWSIIYISIGYYFGNYMYRIESFLNKFFPIISLLIIIVLYTYYKKNKKHA